MYVWEFLPERKPSVLHEERVLVILGIYVVLVIEHSMGEVRISGDVGFNIPCKACVSLNANVHY